MKIGHVFFIWFWLVFFPSWYCLLRTGRWRDFWISGFFPNLDTALFSDMLTNPAIKKAFSHCVAFILIQQQWCNSCALLWFIPLVEPPLGSKCITYFIWRDIFGKTLKSTCESFGYILGNGVDDLVVNLIQFKQSFLDTSSLLSNSKGDNRNKLLALVPISIFILLVSSFSYYRHLALPQLLGFLQSHLVWFDRCLTWQN